MSTYTDKNKMAAIPHPDTPKYLFMKSDAKLRWKAHVKIKKKR